MTQYDVHTDKAIKELRARLDQAERERDEARRERDEARASAIRVGEECDAALRSLGRTQTALDEERRTCTKALQERDEARAALARDVVAAKALCGVASGGDLRSALARVLGITRTRAAEFVDAYDDYTDADIAAAIRAAREVKP